jgi:hypothetical protein
MLRQQLIDKHFDLSPQYLQPNIKFQSVERHTSNLPPEREQSQDLDC